MEEHTIYLIKTAKAIDNNESVFKIGKTRQPDFKRFSKYPKGTKFVAQFRCNNCHIMENRLLEIFNTEFIRRRDYGYEYFEGDVSKMTTIITTEINKEREETEAVLRAKAEADKQTALVVPDAKESSKMCYAKEAIEVPDTEEEPDTKEVHEVPDAKEAYRVREVPEALDTQDDPTAPVTEAIQAEITNNESTEKQGAVTKLYKCDLCHYDTLVSASYDKHLTSAKHLALTEEANTKVFRCETCDYITIKKSCYDKHLTSVKHRNELRLLKNDDGMLVCNYCSKAYNSRTGLWLHKKKCSQQNNAENTENADESEKEEDVEEEEDNAPLENKMTLSATMQPIINGANGNTVIPTEILMQLIKENQDSKSAFIEQNKSFMASMNEERQVTKTILEKYCELQQYIVTNRG